MRKRNIILGAVGALVIAVIAALYAAHHKSHHFGEHMHAKISDSLQLSDAQQVELKTTMTEARRQMRQIRREFRQQRRQGAQIVSQLLDADSLDQARAMRLVRDNARKLETHAEQMIASIAGFTDSLEPGQRRQLQQMMQKHLQKRKHRHDDDDDHDY